MSVPPELFWSAWQVQKKEIQREKLILVLKVTSVSLNKSTCAVKMLLQQSNEFQSVLAEL